MEPILIAAGGLVAVLAILTMLYKFKKLKEEYENKLETMKLLIRSVQDNQEHTNQVIFDLVQLNKLENEKLKNQMEQYNNSMNQQLDEFKKSMEEQASDLHSFKDEIVHNFTEFQKVVSPQFQESNRSTHDMAEIIKSQIEQTVESLRMRLAEAKEELLKANEFQLLRTKDAKEQQLQTVQAKVNAIEGRLRQFQQYENNLSSIVQSADKQYSMAKEITG